MNELINQIATSGDLAASSADMRILLSIFMFSFVVIIMCSIIIALSSLGGVK